LPNHKNRGGGRVRVLRNGREIESFYKWDLKFTKLIRMPCPDDPHLRKKLETGGISERASGRMMSSVNHLSKYAFSDG